MIRQWIDVRAQVWALIAVIAGIGLLLGIKLVEDPEATPRDLLFELGDIAATVLTSVGVMLLFRVTERQHDEHLKVLRDLEVVRLEGRRWRLEARSHLDGLGRAINEQFSRWNLTEAEREVALLLLKALATRRSRLFARLPSARSVSRRDPFTPRQV